MTWNKARTKKRSIAGSIILIFVLLLLFCGILATSVSLANGIKASLEDSAYNSLMHSSEIIRQNIDAEMQADLTMVSTFSQMLHESDDAHLAMDLKMICTANGLLHACYVDDSGRGIDENGGVFDVSSLKVEETALGGQVSISPSYTGETGQQQIVYQAPVYEGEKVVGAFYVEVVATRYFREEAFTFFDGEARASLFNRSDGTFAIKAPQTNLAYLKSDNIYEAIQFGNNDPAIYEDFREKVNDGSKAIIQLEYGNVSSFVAILPCRTASNYYVVTIIGQDALLREASTISTLITLMQAVMAVGFIVVLAVAVFRVYREGKLRQKEKARELEAMYEERSRARDRRLSDIVMQEYEVQEEINLDTMEYTHTFLGGSEMDFHEPDTGDYTREYYINLETVLPECRDDCNRTCSPEALRRDAAKEQPAPATVRYAVTVDGIIKWIETTVYHTKTSEGSLAYLMSKNVTAVVEAEQTAQQAETERKMHLEQLQKTQEELRMALTAAQSANVAKTQFLSNMSHDIRTPMNAIVNMTEFAIEAVGNPEEQRGYLRVLRESSASLLSIINDVLDMSRIESGRMELNLTPISLAGVLDGVCSIMRPLFAQKEQTFQVDFSGNIAGYVLGDRVKLSQIFTNLLNNAMKFTPNKGTICFKAQQIPALRDDMAVFRFIVSDTGMGISEENQAHIFEPFVRSEDSRVYGIEGTGLGLPICKGFISAMSGTIRLESETGHGSTFTVELPFTKSEAPVPDKDVFDESVQAPFAGLQALLLEDVPANSAIAVRVLKRVGFAVDTAPDGKIGSEMFIASKPGTYDVIYMDLQMPGMDGYEATAAIRNSAHPEAKTIPIIAMTANVFAEDIERCRAAGMDGHVGKPITAKALTIETKRTFNR